MMDKAQTILKNVFGYDTFRSMQEPVIANVLKRKDTLAIMPTGSGKSLCYQIPALMFNGLTIVISPLISLMKDQVEQLREQGVPVTLLNSSLSYTEYMENVDRLRSGEIKLLYLAPETLLKQRTLDLLSHLPVQVDCLTIDEAHCISEWGHDFRPEYRQLVQVRNRFPAAVCVALTATATPRVREDIERTLNFDRSNQFIDSFDRPNLYLRVIPKRNPTNLILRFLQKYRNQPGIIYCATRKQVDELTGFLQGHSFSVMPYHAGLPDNQRKRHQEMFTRDDVQIIVATIAFGMGINKSNVRFIVHYDLPRNIESYYQEIGRAGRDGVKAYCLMMFSYADIHKIKYFINQKDEKEQRIANIHLNSIVGYAETGDCRRIPMLDYFGERYSRENCGMCDNCVQKEKDQIDITAYAQSFLTCVAQTDQIFGVQHIIDVLRGSSNQKVLKFNHNQLPLYGTGKELSKRQWLFLSRQLVQKGLVRQELDFGSLKLSPRGMDVLDGRMQVFGIFQEDTSPEPAASRNRGEREGVQEYDRDLFEILRQKRKEIANKFNIPPYVVFSDKSLIEMTLKLPKTRDDFLNVHGVGRAKIEKYSDDFIPIITDYCIEKNIPIEQNGNEIKMSYGILDESLSYRANPDRVVDIDNTTEEPPVKKEKKKKSKKKHLIIAEAFNDGLSINQLAQAHGIQVNTIIVNLIKYLDEGGSIRTEGILEDSLLTPHQHEDIMELFEKHGAKTLRPIYDGLNGEVDWEELKFQRLYFLSLRNS